MIIDILVNNIYSIYNIQYIVYIVNNFFHYPNLPLLNKILVFMFNDKNDINFKYI